MNPLLLVDFYKVHHNRMYPKGTTMIYSNLTPRKSRLKGVNEVVVFGIQHFILDYLIERFNKKFFHVKMRERIKDPQNSEWLECKKETLEEYARHAGAGIDLTHIEKLWDLGYLPIEIKCLEEGSKCPIGVPMLTIKNTHPDFAWLVNYLETLMSCMLWQPITSATIAYEYKKLLSKYALETTGSTEFVQWQGHDFSMRGMSSVESAILSGMGHLTSFTGTDTIPAIYQLESSYSANGLIGASVPATEHSVMCMGTKEDEIGTFKALLDKYPTGILSVVSDTWDLWKVCTEYLPALKDHILSRNEYPKATKIIPQEINKDNESILFLKACDLCENEEIIQIGNRYFQMFYGPEHDSWNELFAIPGKLVIRPDSGDPVDIICGAYINKAAEKLAWGNVADTYDKHIERYSDATPFKTEPQFKGVIELLWDIFGGTVNEHGYKVLDSHVGAIYGDSITLDRAEQICQRLKSKGFASTNIVLGIGSYTYQYNTRDTFGFAVKATYGEVRIKDCTDSCFEGKEHPVEAREIFKDPITDDGTKRSKKGLLQVCKNDIHAKGNENLFVVDQCSWKEERYGELQTVFKDGRLVKEITLQEIRNRLKF